MLPALSTDLFGLPHAGVNYGFLALGHVGSLAFPFAVNLWGWKPAALACRGRRSGGLCGHVGTEACRADTAQDTGEREICPL